jgi:hypothetical protein
MSAGVSEAGASDTDASVKHGAGSSRGAGLAGSSSDMPPPAAVGSSHYPSDGGTDMVEGGTQSAWDDEADSMRGAGANHAQATPRPAPPPSAASAAALARRLKAAKEAESMAACNAGEEGGSQA